MFLVTCYKIDCTTPHFFVNPHGGRIPLVAKLEAPDSLSTVPTTTAGKLGAMFKVHSAQGDRKKFSDEEIEIIKEWYHQMQEQIIASNSGFTSIERKPKVEDYLVMQCESGHKNYIPLEKDDNYKKPEKISWWQKLLNKWKS